MEILCGKNLVPVEMVMKFSTREHVIFKLRGEKETLENFHQLSIEILEMKIFIAAINLISISLIHSPNFVSERREIHYSPI
jgi:hypothetical protein